VTPPEKPKPQRPAGPPAGRFAVREGAGDAARAGQAPALSTILREVNRCVAAVRAGQSWSALSPTVPGHLRPAVQALAFSVWRKQGLATALLRELAPRAPDAPTSAALIAALALLNTEPAPYADHTLVSQAVDALRADKKLAAKAGFVNACLRRFLRERDALLAKAQQGAQARWNLPAWWIERLRRDHAANWQDVAEQSHVPAAMVLRAAKNAQKQPENTIFEEKTGLAGVPSHFVAMNKIAYQVGREAWALTAPKPVVELPGFEAGQISVQDAAAQLAAPLLLENSANAALRVLDACAAPGGKSVHLLQWLQHQRSEHTHTLWALERDAQRAERIHDNLARCKPGPNVRAEVKVVDAAATASWWDGQPFDAILLDAPCTASGIVRRHPDVAWLRRETDVAQLADEQRRLLDALWPLVKVGGHLLYCTCSVFRAEGSEQAQAFVARNTDALALPAPGHLLPRRSAPGDPFADNEPCERDGFFYALFQKRADA
jgi:16S rRNA (cytosine967-C5)-methyltransferase